MFSPLKKRGFCYNRVHMIAASVGVGTGDDAYQAGLEASNVALSGLPNKKADALLVFGSVSFDQDKLIVLIINGEVPVKLDGGAVHSQNPQASGMKSANPNFLAH